RPDAKKLRAHRSAPLSDSFAKFSLKCPNETNHPRFRHVCPASGACGFGVLARNQPRPAPARHGFRHRSPDGAGTTRLAESRCDLDQPFSFGSHGRPHTISFWFEMGPSDEKPHE